MQITHRFVIFIDKKISVNRLGKNERKEFCKKIVDQNLPRCLQNLFKLDVLFILEFIILSIKVSFFEIQ